VQGVWVVLPFGISPILSIRSKLTAVDEQADDEIGHLEGLRETNRLAHQALDPRAQRQMFAFQLLRVAFPYFMIRGVQMSLIRPQPSV
jgi:hypothetical protein